MSGFLEKLLNRVVILNLSSVDSSSRHYIYESLKRVRRSRIEAIIVSINSAGKSISEAKLISETLKGFALSKQTPLYCFAEDACLGSANILLTTGLKCFISKFTMLGHFKSMAVLTSYNKFAQKVNVKHEFITNSHNELNVDSFRQDTEASRKFMEEYLKISDNELKARIFKNRDDAFRLSLKTKEEIEKQVFENSVITPAKAVQFGLVDGIKSVDEFLEERYAGVKKIVFPIDEFKKARTLLQY